MKTFGGKWSRGDILTAIGVIAAVLAIPGMPKLFHWDSEKPLQKANENTEKPQSNSVAKPVQRSRDVSSGQVNFGCDQELAVSTPVVYFGKNPRNVDTRPAWANTDNVKTQSSPAVINVENPINHQPGIKASGSIRGRDSDVILGIKNCPGGGHGELILHVAWIEDEE